MQAAGSWVTVSKEKSGQVGRSQNRAAVQGPGAGVVVNTGAYSGCPGPISNQ